MVWRGSGEQSVSDRQRSPEEMQEILNDIVSQIMESFPPETSG